MSIEQALVIGAGVSGLTTAVRLQEAGLATRILTRETPDDTVSRVAAAVWHPYRAYPEDRVNAWSLQSLDVFRRLAEDPETGVVFHPLYELFQGQVPEPGWRRQVEGLRKPRPEELARFGDGRNPRFRDGWVLPVPVIETPIYVPWLLERFEAGGGTLEVDPKGAPPLDELTRPDRLVVCCVGLGARDYLDDAEMVPIRGQVVAVDNPGLERIVVDEEGPGDPTYAIPRSEDVILGGTTWEGVEDLAPDPEVTAEILARNRRLQPSLERAAVRRVLVGLRPGRSAVRLEGEHRSMGPVIHNYGHGGAGYTLSWGCADEVVTLMRQMAKSTWA